MLARSSTWVSPNNCIPLAMYIASQISNTSLEPSLGMGARRAARTARLVARALLRISDSEHGSWRARPDQTGVQNGRLGHSIVQVGCILQPIAPFFISVLRTAVPRLWITIYWPIRISNAMPRHSIFDSSRNSRSDCKWLCMQESHIETTHDSRPWIFHFLLVIYFLLIIIY